MPRLPALLLASVFGLASAANGQTLAGEATGLSSPVTTITFSELGLASGTALTNQYAAFGVSFSNLWQDPQSGFFATPSAGNFAQPGGAIFNPITIFFSSPVMGAAFNINSNEGESFFEAFLGATSQHSFSAPTGLFDEIWYGFDGIAFDRIEILAGGSNNAMLIDNLQIGGAPTSTVPEPASMTLLATGLAGLAAARRRKKTS